MPSTRLSHKQQSLLRRPIPSMPFPRHLHDRQFPLQPLRFALQDPASPSSSGSRFTNYFASPSPPLLPPQWKDPCSPPSTRHSSPAPNASSSKNSAKVPIDDQTMPKGGKVRFSARSPTPPSPYALLTTGCYTTSAATRT